MQSPTTTQAAKGSPLTPGLARLQKLIWILIYGGLLGLVVGHLTRREDDALGLALVVLGAVAVAAGVVLIWVRSRLGGAQR